MHIIAIVVLVVAIILMTRFGVLGVVIVAAIPYIAALLGGMVAAGIVSAFATPVVGLPLGLIAGIAIFSKLAKRK